MTPRRALPAAVLLFVVLATANSGGYRYGISDQAFYVPAIASVLNPALFPRDRPLLEAQMRFWAGDEVARFAGHLVGHDLPVWFALLYLCGVAALAVAAVAFARSAGADWWTTAAFLLLLTFRHRIARTGANSLEGFGAPRVLAYALGLGALAGTMTGRLGAAALLLAAALVVHPTTAGWFLLVAIVALLWKRTSEVLFTKIVKRTSDVLFFAGVAIAAAAAICAWMPLPARVTIMDPTWISAFAQKDYLFPAEWPLYAWLLNLLYPVVILLVYRRRVATGAARPGEAGVIAGLVALVALFVATLPLTERHVAFAVQLQINRVFWLLDGVTAFYAAWWMTTAAGARWGRTGAAAIVAVLAVAATARGSFLLARDGGRPLVQLRLAPTDWNRAMAWLRPQPASWHVLADPGHAVTFGPSVRVAAEKDTLLEDNKDSAIAIYDRGVAMRVLERRDALADFASFTEADLRRLAARYDLDVFVDRAGRRFDLPVLYQNDGFIIYDLR